MATTSDGNAGGPVIMGRPPGGFPTRIAEARAYGTVARQGSDGNLPNKDDDTSDQKDGGVLGKFLHNLVG